MLIIKETVNPIKKTELISAGAVSLGSVLYKLYVGG